MSSITSSMVGLTMNCPQILPIRIIPIGPPQGISDNIRAADVALAAITSGSCFPSDERTLAITLNQAISIKKHLRTNGKFPENQDDKSNRTIPEPHGKIQQEIMVVWGDQWYDQLKVRVLLEHPLSAYTYLEWRLGQIVSLDNQPYIKKYWLSHSSIRTLKHKTNLQI